MRSKDEENWEEWFKSLSTEVLKQFQDDFNNLPKKIFKEIPEMETAMTTLENVLKKREVC